MAQLQQMDMAAATQPSHPAFHFNAGQWFGLALAAAISAESAVQSGMFKGPLAWVQFGIGLFQAFLQQAQQPQQPTSTTQPTPPKIG